MNKNRLTREVRVHPLFSGCFRLIVLVRCLGWLVVKSVDMVSKTACRLATFCTTFNGALVGERHSIWDKNSTNNGRVWSA